MVGGSKTTAKQCIVKKLLVTFLGCLQCRLGCSRHEVEYRTGNWDRKVGGSTILSKLIICCVLVPTQPPLPSAGWEISSS